jgi:hypothetical protein
LAGSVGIVLVGLEKIEPTARGRAISNHDARSIPVAPWDCQGDAVIAKRYTLPVDRHMADLERDGVERQFLGARIDATHIESRRRSEAVGSELKLHLEEQVVDGERTIAFEMMRA